MFFSLHHVASYYFLKSPQKMYKLHDYILVKRVSLVSNNFGQDLSSMWLHKL